jgi:hypothetical protein
MNLEIKIKEGKNTTTYTADFTPTEESIKSAVKAITAFVKSVTPKVTKTTETKQDIS